jgi:hypothetical protein
LRVSLHELGNDTVESFLGVDSIAMDGIWTTRTEQDREEILEATLKARGGHPWRTDASSTQKISKNPGTVVSIRPQSNKRDCWVSW